MIRDEDGYTYSYTFFKGTQRFSDAIFRQIFVSDMSTFRARRLGGQPPFWQRLMTDGTFLMFGLIKKTFEILRSGGGGDGCCGEQRVPFHGKNAGINEHHWVLGK